MSGKKKHGASLFYAEFPVRLVSFCQKKYNKAMEVLRVDDRMAKKAAKNMATIERMIICQAEKLPGEGCKDGEAKEEEKW